MIVFEEEVAITNMEELHDFCQILHEELFDEDSEKLFQEFVPYMEECVEADIQLTNDVHKQIGEDIIPVVSLASFNSDIYFSALSSEEDREVSLREQLLFHSLCDKHFKKIRSFEERFYDVMTRQ